MQLCQHLVNMAMFVKHTAPPETLSRLMQHWAGKAPVTLGRRNLTKELPPANSRVLKVNPDNQRENIY